MCAATPADRSCQTCSFSTSVDGNNVTPIYECIRCRRTDGTQNEMPVIYYDPDGGPINNFDGSTPLLFICKNLSCCIPAGAQCQHKCAVRFLLVKRAVGLRI